MAEWFLRLGESSLGPYSSKQFAAMAVDGRLLPTDSIRRDDMTAWVPASKLNGLSFPPELPPPLPTAAPEPSSPAHIPRTTADRWLIKCVGAVEAIRRRPSLAVLGVLIVVSATTTLWPWGNGARAMTNGGRGLASNPSKAPSASNFPLSWQKLLQMTGEGPNTRKYLDVDGRLRRIESRYGIQVLVAVEAVGDGFAVAVANQMAVADFTTRYWFTAEEREMLQNLYAEFVADFRGNKSHRATLPRFEVTMRRDREISSYACFELQPRSN
jgi:hypothetical protein